MTAKPKRRFFWLYMLALMICAALCSVVTFTQLSVPTPDPSLSEDQRLATRIIAGATATVNARNNPFLRLWGSIISVFNPPPPTATPRRSIVSPTPTLTDAQLEQFPSRWLADLESAAGFSHPAFTDSVDTFFQGVSFDTLRHARLDPPQAQRVTYEGETYVVVVPIPTRYILSGGGTQVLLFKMMDDIPTLIYENDETLDPLRSMTVDGFADHNSNGYPDLTITAQAPVSCPRNQLLLIEIRDNDEVVNITPQGTEDLLFAQWRYLEDNTTLALQMLEFFNTPYAFDSCSYPTISRYFVWDGTEYQDVSATIDEANYPVLSTFWDNLAPDAVCLIPDPLMYEMLLTEYVRGNSAEAWERLEPRLRWDECSAETLAGWEITSFEEWVTTLYLTAPTPTP